MTITGTAFAVGALGLLGLDVTPAAADPLGDVGGGSFVLDSIGSMDSSIGSGGADGPPSAWSGSGSDDLTHPGAGTFTSPVIRTDPLPDAWPAPTPDTSSLSTASTESVDTGEADVFAGYPVLGVIDPEVPSIPLEIEPDMDASPSLTSLPAGSQATGTATGSFSGAPGTSTGPQAVSPGDDTMTAVEDTVVPVPLVGPATAVAPQNATIADDPGGLDVSPPPVLPVPPEAEPADAPSHPVLMASSAPDPDGSESGAGASASDSSTPSGGGGGGGRAGAHPAA
ncbi:MAG: hypothetical protein LH603_11080, partial [Pseudonocardia sp.]|nr:hypothetical protein [Pseudonocardia sp.]